VTAVTGHVARPLSIGCDVGGSKILMACYHEDGTFSGRVRARVPGSAPAIIAMIAGYALAHAPRGTPIGAAVAGLVTAGGSVLSGSYIKWDGMSVAAEISAATGAPAYVLNDADAAAWGEHHRRGPGPRPLLMVTVGTGVGGGLVTAGRIYRGATGISLEVGHILADPCGPRCGCGSSGCVETLSSGTAIASRYHELSRAGSAITAREVVAYARSGDKLAQQVVSDAGHWLGRGLASLTRVLDPGLIVIGGSVARAGGMFLGPAEDALHHHRMPHAAGLPRLSLTTSECGGDAGLYGAAVLAAAAQDSG
jgi:glucokinase